MNRKLAWKATQIFLTVEGATAMIAFAATLQWWLMLIGAGTVGGTWFLIYKLLIGLEEKRNNDSIAIGSSKCG